jgi:hypothetical protein
MTHQYTVGYKILRGPNKLQYEVTHLIFITSRIDAPQCMPDSHVHCTEVHSSSTEDCFIYAICSSSFLDVTEILNYHFNQFLVQEQVYKNNIFCQKPKKKAVKALENVEISQ